MKSSQLLAVTFMMALNTASSFAEHAPAGSRDNLSHPEPGEHLPGGNATYTGRLDEDAFSHPSANMDREHRLDFQIGNGFFKRLWVSAPASTQAADGLGPLYNARSCLRCHIRDGRSHPPEDPQDNAVSMTFHLSIPPTTPEQLQLLAQRRVTTLPEPTYGHQLQDFAIQGHRAEGKIQIDYDEQPLTLADGTVVHLRKPKYSISDLAYGPLATDTRISPRVAPPMIGLGLLEAIDEQDILALADPDDRNGDGISGRPNLVWSVKAGREMLGRYGLKAASPSIDEQSQLAFANDIGISVPLHPAGSGDCSEKQSACLKAPDGNSPQYDNLEAHQEVTDLVTFYAENLAVPARRDHDAPIVLAGKRLFHQSGCTACHRPSHTTRAVPDKPHLSNQRIWPYTDLLLHDMGEGLSDNRPEGVADGREWRTAPLWGIGLTRLVSGKTTYLHDGRARSLLEAILWHGGEAQAARHAVIKMSAEERKQLLSFLQSL